MHVEETDADRESVSAITSSTSPTKQNSASPPGPVWASTVDKLQLMMKEWIAATFLYEASEENDLKEVFTLFVWLNFTTRGVIAIYESVGTTLLLDQYNLTELEAGGLVSLSGVVGTVNLLLFRDVWTKKFDDMTLMCGGLLLMLVAQLFIVNYGVEQPHALWQYAFSQSLVYAFGYPIGNSAVLGMFAILSKRERQGQRQGQFARMGSVSRILLPTIAAYMNQYLNPLSSFALACVLMCASLLGVVFLFHKIMFFRYGNTSTLTDHEYRHQPLLRWQKLAIVVLSVFAVFAFSLSVL
jgi:MFS family permease